MQRITTAILGITQKNTIGTRSTKLRRIFTHFRWYLVVAGIAGTLIAVTLLVTSSLLATSHRNPYDINQNDMIEWVEMEKAVWDYMVDGTITQAQAVDEVLRLLAGIPALVNPPTHRPSSQPSPTIGAHPTTVPTATQAPTATPIPTLVAPTITYTMGNTAGLQISWSYPEALASLVTGYEVQYSLLGEEYNYSASRGAHGHGVNGNIPIGAEVALRVRAHSKTASSAWATGNAHDTSTYTNAYDNGCLGREKLDSDTPSDIRMAAMFRNSPRPEREPWEEPKAPKFEYGFILRNVDGEEPGPLDSGGLIAKVDSDGFWHVEVRSGYVWTDGGWQGSYQNLLIGTSWWGNKGASILLSSGIWPKPVCPLTWSPRP